MHKKILALFFAVLFVFLCVPVSAFASETETTFEYKNLDNTTVEADLQDVVNLDQYVVNSSIKNVSVITFAEQDVNSETDCKNLKLYVYIYNPTGKLINANGKNYIQLGKSEKDIAKYKLKFIDKNNANTLYKFKVETFNYYDKASITRGYFVSGIELQHGSDIKDYEVGGAWIFTGYGASAKLDRVSTFETISLDVKFTTYRVPYDITSTTEYSHQLTSVYFSVPKYYEERYGEVYGMECVYERYYTKPYVVVNNDELYLQLRNATSTLLPLTEMKNSKTGKDYYSGAIANGLYVATVSSNFSSFHYYWRYNLSSFAKGAEYEYTYGERILPVLLHIEQKFDEDFWISSEEVTDEVNAFYASSLGKNDEYKNAEIGDYYHSLLFEDYWVDSAGIEHRFEHRTSDNGSAYYSARVYDTITFDSEEFNIYSYSSSHNWFNKLNDIGIKSLWSKLKNDVTYEGLSRVERVSDKVSGIDSKVVSASYLVNENEVADFKSEVAKASLNGSSVFLFRLDVAPYKVSELMTNHVVDNKLVGHAISFQEPVYMGFDVIKLKFRDDNGEVVDVPVVSTPKDFIGGVNAPPTNSTVSKLEFPDWDDIAEKLSKTFRTFSIICIILLVICAVVFLTPWVKGVVAKGKKASTKARRRVNKNRRRR